MIKLPIEVGKVDKNKKQRCNTYTLLGFPYYIVLALLIVFPMFLIILYSVTDKSTNLPILGFTFNHYIRFFGADSEFISILLESLKFAVLTTFITLIFGYPFAFFITKFKSKTQGLLILLISAPMWINMFLRIIAWRQILSIGGPIHKFFSLFGIQIGKLLGTDFAIILGMSYVFLPFMIIPIYNALNKIDDNLIQSSKDLGANSFQTFKRVILPLSIPGILSGVTMVMLPAATTLVVPKYLGEGKILIGNVIEKQFINNGNWNYGSAIAVILAIVIILLVKVTNKLDKMRE